MTFEELSALERAIVRHSKGLRVAKGDTLWLSYGAFLRYFKEPAQLTRDHLIIGASFTYAWMPTMLDFRSTEFDAGVSILNDARHGHRIGQEELLALTRIVNNSVVGASKLLHFVAPERFAIWDSRVAAYLRTRVHGGAQGAARYVAYNDCCLTLATSAALAPVVAWISSEVGFTVSPVRAIELVMYDAAVRNLTFLSDEDGSAR